MPATDVIFRIGTMGISKAQAEMGAVVGALVAIGKVVVDNIKKADDFSDAWSSLSQKQKAAVQSMDTATKGFISTLDATKTAGKLATAGIDATGQQMAALGTLAAATAKKLGEGPEGAKTRLDALTDSLIKGNARGLKPYGIELESTGKLSEKQAEAFAKITQKAEGLTVELDGLDDKWAALNNEIDKNVGLTYDWLASVPLIGGALDGVRNGLAEYNKMMVDTNGGIADLVYSTEGAAFTFKSLQNNIGAAAAELLGFDKVAATLNANQLLNRTEAARFVDKKGKENAANKPKTQIGGGGETAPARRGGGGGRRERAAVDEGYDFTIEDPAVTDLLANFGKGNAKEFVDDLFEKLPEIARAENEINQALFEQVNSMSSLVIAEDERLSLLRTKMELDLDGMTVDEKHELWKSEEEHEQAMIAYEQERNEYLGKNKDAIEENTDVVNRYSIAGQRMGDLLSASMMASHNAFVTLFKSIVSGAKMSAKAFAQMVSSLLYAISEQFAVLAVAEFAQAIISAASKKYAEAAMHAAAGGVCIAVAAAAAVAGAVVASMSNNIGGSKASTGSIGHSGGGGGVDSYGGGESNGSYGSSNDDRTEIIEIKVDGSMANLLAQLATEAKRQKRSGAYAGGF